MSTASRPVLRMMVRPRWIAALVLALAVAAAFALLGQWQVERAVEQAVVADRPTEEVRPFDGLVEPDEPTPQSATGQRVEVAGTWVAGDTVLVDGRLNDGTPGTWVVAHLEVADAPAGGLPVALGWAEERADAEAALERFDAEAGAAAGADEAVTVTGRFLPSEAPMLPGDDADPQRMQTVAVAQLINVWEGYDDRPVYFGYVTAAEPFEGLEAIVSPPPEQTAELNWLNVFYAVEWVVFAAFAIYLWYRLVRDAVEREREEAEQAANASAGTPVA
ncbi:SURF1 family protein [Agromyces sp. CFH 90414]|uniref:SURF1-like protein n=1 Tax=Agromyces agglutinans TaxID=2662258 RepID=A0A6I2F9E3_9MICO|nr:SURF1 family cytochrome oxidase biogenesis protein [Agromyces agglutinans]MRG61259.1 SURF1 family protein [Agromyces agglutinans]